MKENTAPKNIHQCLRGKFSFENHSKVKKWAAEFKVGQESIEKDQKYWRTGETNNY